MVEEKITCEECKKDNIFIDTINGEVVCTSCGYVLGDKIWWKKELHDK